MSFLDLEAGLNPKPTRNSSLTNSEAGFLPKKISQKIFKISSSISSLRRIVDQLGTPRDTQKIRSQLQELTEATREIIKETSSEIKLLSTQTSGLTSAELNHRKLEQQKLTKDFQKVLEQFHAVQRLSAEKSREVVDYITKVYNEEEENSEEQPLLVTTQRTQLEALDNEVEFNQGMIEEREHEIREIEQGITELNEVFRDLGTFVNEQQGLLDNIESNVSSVALNTHQASTELRVANEYQKKSRSKMCFIFAILFVVALIFTLVFLS